jgi:flagellar hook protein FlgE
MLGHERALNVISNNVSNMNTPGFRASTVDFADVFNGVTQDNKSAGQQGSGGGLDVTRTSLDMTAGAQQQTGNGLDLFLQGAGFFVLQDASGSTRYTRDGSFEFDSSGNLVAKGETTKVMSRDASGALVPLNLGSLKLSPAKPTTAVNFGDNLSPDDNSYTISNLTVFDKLGGSHTLSVSFTRSTDPTNPGNPGGSPGGTPGNPGDPGTPGGTNSQDNTTWNMTVSEGGNPIGAGTLEFSSTQVAPTSLTVPMTLALQGVDPTDIDFNFNDVTGFATQAAPDPTTGATGTASKMSVEKQDGFAPGTITSETFDAQGVLKISYSNGQTADGAKLVLADIPDPTGLVEVSNSQFIYQGSQPVTLRAAGDDLTVLSQSLESSNVDLTTEFSTLILMQRGYQASSQVVSTANDMMQQLLEIRGTR